MQKQIVAIAFVASAMISGAVACSSSSNTGTGTGTGDGGTTGSDGGGGSDGNTTGGDSGGSGEDSGGCIPIGAPGNSQGVGKYCATEADCLSNPKATLCATLGGDPTEDFCTYQCTIEDGGPDPCGDNATCACQGGQCGCTPTACQ